MGIGSKLLPEVQNYCRHGASLAASSWAGALLSRGAEPLQVPLPKPRLSFIVPCLAARKQYEVFHEVFQKIPSRNRQFVIFRSGKTGLIRGGKKFQHSLRQRKLYKNKLCKIRW